MVNAKITGLPKLLKVWKKSSTTRGWMTGALRRNLDEKQDKYCLLGALACEKGLKPEGNFLNYEISKTDMVTMTFEDILIMYDIPLSTIVRDYKCPICSEEANLAEIIVHLNDQHLIDFEKALKFIPQLKAEPIKEVYLKDRVNKLKRSRFYNFWKNKQI